MKTIFKYFLSAVLVILTAASCEKFLDTSSPSAKSDEELYSNYTLASNTIANITQSLGETNSYRGRFLSWAGLNSDIEWYNTFKVSDEKYQIASFSLLPNNGQLNLSNGPFAMMYEGVEKANLAIKGLREYGNTETDSEMAYLLGEALTLRAMLY